MAGFDVGTIYATLAARFRGGNEFAAFDRHMSKAEARAAKPIEAELGAEVDERAFAEYERALNHAERQAKRRDAFKAKLGGDFDERAFNEAERSMARYERTGRGVERSASRMRREHDLLGGSVSRLNSGLKGLIPNLNYTTRIPVGKIGAIAVAIASIIAPTVSLAGALGPLTGLLGALPGLAVTGIGALVTASLGLRGIGDAVKAAWDAQTQAGIGAAKSADTAIDKTRQVEQAQRDLNDARKQAKRDLQDLREEVERQGIAEEDARIKMQRAREELARLQGDPTARASDIQQARNDIKSAHEDLEDTRRDGIRNAHDLAKAEQDGVKGAPAVVQAQNALADALRNQAVAADTATGAQATLEKKMADLGPAGQHFVQVIERNVFPLFKRLRNEAQQGLLPGLAGGIVGAERNFPRLERVVRSYSDALGDAAKRQGQFLGQQDVGRDLEQVFSQGERVIRKLGEGTTIWERGLLHVAVAAKPLLDWAGDMNVRLATMFETWAEGGRETGKLEAFFRRSIATTETVVTSLWNFGRALINIGTIGRRVWGKDMLGGIEDTTKAFRRWTESVRGQASIERYFVRWRKRWEEVAEEIGKVIKRYRDLRDQGKSITESLTVVLAEAYAKALENVAETVGKAAPEIAKGFVNGFLDSNAFGKLAIGGWLVTKMGGPSAVGGAGRKLATLLFGGFSGAAVGGGGFLAKLTERGSNAANPIWVHDIAGGGGGGSIVKDVAKSGRVTGALTALRVVGSAGLAGGVVLAPLVLADQLQKGGLQPAHRDPRTGAPLPTGKTPGVAMPDPREAKRAADKVKDAWFDASDGITKRFRRVGEAFDDAFARRQQNAIERSRKRVNDLAGELSHLGRGTDDYRTKAGELDRAQERLNKRVRATQDAAGHAGKGFRGLSANAIETGETLGLLGTYIVNSTNSILKEFGAKRIEHSVTKFHAHQRGPGLSTNQQGGWAGDGALRRFMGGGWLGGSPSLVGDDSILVAAAPGEGFVNRHQRPFIEQAMAIAHAVGGSPFGSMSELFGAVRTPHRMAEGGIVPIPGMPGESIKSDILQDVLGIIRKYRVTVTDGYAPTGHAAGGEHPLGLAIDVVPGPGGSWGRINTAMNDAGYPNPPNYPFRWLGWLNEPDHGPPGGPTNPAMPHGHFSWLHGGAHGFKAAGGSGDFTIPRFMVKGGTASTRDALQGASDRDRKAANKFLERRLAALLPAFGAGKDASVIHGDGEVESVFAHIARRLSTSPVATLALGEAGFAESGMRDLSYGDSSSQGALQLLASTAAGLGVSPHDEGAIASLFLTRGFYSRGANESAAMGLPAHLAAQAAQGSAFASGSNYLAQEGNARGWMKRFGLQRGGLIPGFAKGGMIDHLAYVGDSLGVGTLGPGGLAGKLGKIKLRSSAKQSRTPGQGLPIFKGLLSKLTDAGVFDLGTNGAFGDLQSGARGAARALGHRPLVMATLAAAAPQSAQKNSLIRRVADKVVDWGAVSGAYVGTDPMHIHPTKAGYVKRAGMIARAVRGIRAPDIGGGRAPGQIKGLGWVNELLASGSSPAEIALQISDTLGLHPLSRAPRGNWSSRTSGPRRTVLHPIPGFQGGGFVGGQGQLTNKGTKRAGRLGKAADAIRHRIDNLGNKYELQSRRFDMSEEEFINEGNETTPPSLNMDAINRRTLELTALIKTRRDQAVQYGKLVRYLTALNKLWRNMEARLSRTIENARERLKHLGKGKEANRSRKTIQNRIDKWTERLGGVRASLKTGIEEREQADFDWKSTGLDVDELRQELAPLLEGGKGIELPAFEPAGGADAGTGTPDPAEVAAAAREMLASFQSSRADLFGQFGQNFTAAGRNPFEGELGQAAGMRFFGAGSGPGGPLVGSGGAGGPGGGFGEVLGGSGGGGRGINIEKLEQHFPVQPDPMTWARSTVFELEAMH